VVATLEPTTHLNPPENPWSRETHGYPVGFLVSMLVL